MADDDRMTTPGPDDRIIDCVQCGVSFLFNKGEQDFYAEKNLNTPKRCRPCRETRRIERTKGQ